MLFISICLCSLIWSIRHIIAFEETCYVNSNIYFAQLGMQCSTKHYRLWTRLQYCHYSGGNLFTGLECKEHCVFSNLATILWHPCEHMCHLVNVYIMNSSFIAKHFVHLLKPRKDELVWFGLILVSNPNLQSMNHTLDISLQWEHGHVSLRGHQGLIT